MRVRDGMTEQVFTIRHDKKMIAVQEMLRRRQGKMDGKLTGIISEYDLLGLVEKL